MHVINHIKPVRLLAICLFAAMHAVAQLHEFRFLPTKGLAIEQQGFIGRTGDHILLINLENQDAIDLYIHDINSQQGVNRRYAFNSAGMSIINRPASTLFVSCSPGKEGVIAHFLELDERGDVLQKKDIALPALKLPLRILPSANKQHILLYQQVKTTNDSALIRGSLFAPGLDNPKQLLYSFRHGRDLDMDPEVFLDNNGNTHVLVYDKAANYRMSSDLTLNTIPFGDNQIVSETFSFSKIKLKSMRVFQNNECNCIQAEGVYVDGMDKVNKGVYSIAFPPGRKNELAPRFIPFQPELIRNLKRGFSATEAAVQTSLQLQDIFYNDSGSFAVFMLHVGEPQKILSTSPNADMPAKTLQRSIATSRAYDVAPPTTNVPATGPRIRGMPRNTSSGGVNADRNNDLSPIMSSIYKATPPLTSRASGRNAPKIVFLKLDKDRGIAWHASRSLDVFSSSSELYNRQFTAGAAGQQLAVVLYQADAIDEPSPVFIRVQDGRLIQEKFPEKKLLFSAVQQLSPGQFGSLYANTETGESGIVLITVKR